MNQKEKLLQEIIKSLNNEPEEWTFGDQTADNKVWGIRLWIANIPLLNLCVYTPSEIKFTILGRIRLYRAVVQCKAKMILKLKQNE